MTEAKLLWQGSVEIPPFGLKEIRLVAVNKTVHCEHKAKDRLGEQHWVDYQFYTPILYQALSELTQQNEAYRKHVLEISYGVKNGLG